MENPEEISCSNCGCHVEIQIVEEGTKNRYPLVEFCPLCGQQLIEIEIAVDDEEEEF